MNCLLPLGCLALLTAWTASAWGEEKVKDRAKKLVIEKPTAEIVKTSAPADANAFVNPKVEPGAVKWHATLDDACKAAAKSGRPVLLFQMMGKLDEKFC
jgi:hypothetical protein